MDALIGQERQPGDVQSKEVEGASGSVSAALQSEVEGTSADHVDLPNPDPSGHCGQEKAQKSSEQEDKSVESQDGALQDAGEDEIRKILELEEQLKQGIPLEPVEKPEDEILRLKFDHVADPEPSKGAECDSIASESESSQKFVPSKLPEGKEADIVTPSITVSSPPSTSVHEENKEKLETTENRPKMDGSDADGEWSETEGDADDDVTCKDPLPLPISTTKAISSSQPAAPVSTLSKANSYPRIDVRHLPKGDPVDSLMDRIDAELLSITGYQNLNLPKLTRPDKDERSELASLGVQFDSADDSDYGRRVLTRSDRDTGLGTGDDNASERTLTGPRSLNSLNRSLDLGLLTDGTSTGKQAKAKSFTRGMDSVRTEDFEDRFKDTLVPTPKSTGRDPRGRRPVNMSGRDSDLESVKTEDFQREYMKTMIPTDGPPSSRRKRESDIDSVRTEEFERKYKESLLNVQKSLLKEDKAKAIQAAVQARRAMQHAQSQRAPLPHKENMPSYHKPKPSLPWSSKGMCNGSEDTPRTEDFENNYKSMQVKHVAGIPVTSFDDILVDSDIDTVRSSQVRDRLRGAFFPAKGKGYHETPSEMSEDDSLEKKYKEYIQKKMAEIAASSRLPPIEPSLSDIESIDQKALAGEYEDSDNQVEPPPQQPPRGRRSASPAYQFQYDQDISTSQDEDIKENTLEIKRESRRIQREIEEERRKRMTSTPVSRSGRRSASPNRSTKSMDRHYRSKTPDVPQKTAQRSRSPELARIARSLERMSRSQPKVVPVEVPSRPVSPDPTKLFEKELKEKILELDVLTDSIEEAKQEKKALIKELRTLQETCRNQQNEIKGTERQSKENRARCEDSRTELMLLEFKRDSSQQELEEVQAEITKRKKRLRELDDQIRDHMDRMREFEEIGMNPEEVKRLMTERDVLQSEVSNKDALQMERDELQKALLATKEDMFNEQKKYRDRLDNVEEKLETSVKKLEEATVEKADLRCKLNNIEEKYATDTRTKDRIIREKNDDYENLRGKLQNELQNLHEQTVEETGRLRQELDESTNKVSVLKSELEHKDELNLQLTNQVIELQTDLTREGELRDKESDGYSKQMAALICEKEQTTAQIRDQLYKEKQEALDDLQTQFDVERRDLVQRSETKLAEQLAQHHHELIARDEENQALREQIRQLEDAAQNLQEKVRQDVREQCSHTLEQEKRNWEAERDSLWKRELARIGDESARAVQKANDDAEREREISSHLEKQIELLKRELEDQRQQNRNIYKDKLDSLNRVKEMAREERDAEVERVKEQINEGNLKEIARLRESINRKDEEIAQLRSDVEDFLTRERDSQSATDRQEKTILHEINEDCRKTALVLGITPRKVQSPSYKRDPSPSRNTITTAFANLRASNDQLRNYVQEIKQDLEGQRSVMLKLQKENTDCVEELKEKMMMEKNRELEMLRERLIKEHLEEVSQLQRGTNQDKALKQALIDKDNELREIQRNMSSWKEEVAEKFAKKFEEELKRELEKKIREIKRNTKDKDRTSIHQQREIERLEREVQRLTQANILNSCSSDFDTNTVKLLRHLQNRIKELRDENTRLKRSVGFSSISTPDLTATQNDSGYADSSQVRNLEHRIKQAELRAELAEDRASRNENLLTQKMAEVSRLQSALTHQTKELMQLERAYSQMSRSSVRPLSTTEKNWR